MPEINLPVPYKSQWDNDATSSSNDCGPASVAMVLSYFGKTVSTDEVSRLANAGTGLVSVNQLKQAVSSLGFASSFVTSLTPALIDDSLKNNTPLIVLVHYGSLVSRQDKHFTGGHFFVVVGRRSDGGYYVNDPNFKGDLRGQGDHHLYTKEEFEKAWGDCHLDGGNPDFSALVIQPKVEQTSNFHMGVITAGQPVNVRNAPSLMAPIHAVLPEGHHFPVESQGVGDDVLGNKVWYKFGGEESYVWSGRVEIIADPAPSQPKPEDTKKVEVTEPQARAVAVLTQALPLLRDQQGNVFGNEEGMARAFVDGWPSSMQLIVAEKKQRSLLETIAHMLGLG
jgi:hypothetical protein